MAPQNRRTASWQRKTFLLVASLFMGVIWCGVLPSVAQHPTVQRRLEFLDERRIDPSAMFYTELDAMDSILSKSGIR